MDILEIVSHSSEQTEALAAKLALSFKDGDFIVLKGQLGSGKTVFVRGLAAGRGLNLDDVSSPTYTFVNEYRGEKPIYHFDLYRMGATDELVEIGWDDYYDRPGVMVVEWGEKAGDLLPKRYYLVSFKIIGEHERKISISLVQGEKNEN